MEVKLVSLQCRNPEMWDAFTKGCRAEGRTVWSVLEPLIFAYNKDRLRIIQEGKPDQQGGEVVKTQEVEMNDIQGTSG